MPHLLPGLFTVRRADIEGFARELEAKGRARATRRLATIAGFYKYAVEEAPGSLPARARPPSAARSSPSRWHRAPLGRLTWPSTSAPTVPCSWPAPDRHDTGRIVELAIDELAFYCDGMSGRYVDLLAASHPEFGDEAEGLLTATSAPEMKQAAYRLRVIALSVRRQIAGPRSEDALLRLGTCITDPEPGLAELADLAIDVVTAVDYLLSLLDAPVKISRQLALASDAGAGSGNRPSSEDARDWLIRKQLDARGAAVRVGTRLVSGLLSDVSVGL